MPNKEFLEKICRLLRYDILTSTSAAGSGHPTSALSAVELMTALFFAGFLSYDLKDPKNLTNDRLIFSKGHASPLLYSLYHAAGAISYDELLTLRKFGSRLEGHPTPGFPYVDVATGSLGQGLSVGVGMAMGIKKIFDNRYSILANKNTIKNVERIPKIWVLLGDSECDEGQVWEAIESAVRFNLDNLIGILDVNKLGQYGETYEGWNLERYERKVQAFGWNTAIVKDGHDLNQIFEAFKSDMKGKPTMIIARTVKGKGISFLENKEGWHGKVLNEQELKLALKELGEVDLKVRGDLIKPNFQFPISPSTSSGSRAKSRDNFQVNPNNKINHVISKLEKFIPNTDLKIEISTREAYGDTLVESGEMYPSLVVLDAGMANSTYEDKFQKKFPDRFFEMSITEENMTGVALGLSKLGFIPFFSTFAAFLTQTFDQVRMAQYSNANLKIVGSHAGVSIGQDGPSQMGLEDLAMMRSISNSTIFYPADATSTKKLIKIMIEDKGIFYLRTTRGKTSILYDENEEFKIGGCKVHPTSLFELRGVSKVKTIKSKTLIIAAGITLHEALKAQEKLADEEIDAVVIDCYSIKPLDEKTIIKYISEYKNIIVVEDHYPYGGLGEAIASLISNNQLPISNYAHLCVRKIPRSGKPEELLKYEGIDALTIFSNAKEMSTQ